ncbi:protein-L-isoaspartate(D-aspartate) O-methyltransferase [Candidatus Sumerlaeota bacterium]|nr:protein-L-isoaspartate(D-aspartate) O-methyltransferase [Candidatus Sumerlaeota bacterium]
MTLSIRLAIPSVGSLFILLFPSMVIAQTPEAWAARREAMVARQIEDRGVSDPATLAAMRAVPRHEFVPRDARPLAYADQPLPIGQGQTISQPYIVGYMTEQLELEPDDRVLEVGTGSGYQAAVLAEIASPVYTVEIIPALAQSADSRLARLGYDGIVRRQADGYYGWEEHAPFDAIIVTAAAAGQPPPPLIEQLAPGGRLICPVGTTRWSQNLILVTKDEEGAIRTRPLIGVRFVPLTGDHH